MLTADLGYLSMKILCHCILVAIVARLTLVSPTAINVDVRTRRDYLPEPIHFYTFENGLSDEVAMTELRPEGGSVLGGQYRFGPNEGPTLDDPWLELEDYTIEMQIKLQDAMSDGGGYIKLVDFRNLTSDNGIYSIDGSLGYYLYSGEGGEQHGRSSVLDFPQNTYAHVVITRKRDTRMISLYTNGTRRLSLDDKYGDFIVDSGCLRFLQDDFDGYCTSIGKDAQCDSGSGWIGYIKIYNALLTSDGVEMLHLQGEEPLSLTACQCNLARRCANDTLVSGSALHICLFNENESVDISGIEHLQMNQGILSIGVVADGSPTESTTVAVVGHFAMISTYPSSRFFEEPYPLTAEGFAILASSHSTRRLLMRKKGFGGVRRELRGKVLAPFKVVVELIEQAHPPATPQPYSLTPTITGNDGEVDKGETKRAGVWNYLGFSVLAILFGTTVLVSGWLCIKVLFQCKIAGGS